MSIKLTNAPKTLLEVAMSDVEFMALIKYKFTNLIFRHSNKNTLYEGNAGDTWDDTWFCLAYWLAQDDKIRGRFYDYNNYLDAGNKSVAKNNVLSLIKCRMVFFILIDKLLDYYKVDNKSGWVVYNKLQPGKIINTSTVEFSLINVKQAKNFDFKIRPDHTGLYADQIDMIKHMLIEIGVKPINDSYYFNDNCYLEKLKDRLEVKLFPFALNVLSN